MKERKCLKCQKSFESDGNWNRLCDKCNRNNKKQVDLAKQTFISQKEPACDGTQKI